MPATGRREILTGSSQGRPILIVATATPGTLIHTATNVADTFDEIWIWIQNTDTVDRKITIEFGAVTVPQYLIEDTVPAEGGLLLLVPGLTLNGGVVVGAFAAAANVLTAVGYVNRLLNS